EDRRAAVAVDRLVFLLAAPQDLAPQVQAGGSRGAEVDVEALAGHDRRRAGMAVLGMRLRRVRPLLEDLDVPLLLALLRVEAQRPQRLAALHGHCRRQVDLA